MQFRQSTDFYVDRVSIISKSGEVDISAIYEELSVFDSVFLPVMSGKILIVDSIGLSSSLIFDGSESIVISLKKSKEDDDGSYKKSFRIYKQSHRKNITLNSESYVLNFISDEYVYSEQQKINQHYELTYGEIIQSIMKNYLKVLDFQVGEFMEPSSGIRDVIIPNLKPIDAILWLTKRSVDSKQSPNFLFFQNFSGFNLVSISTLNKKPPVEIYTFKPKNILEKDAAVEEFTSVRSLEVVTQFDELDKIKSGANAGKFIGFDPITRTISTRNISYGDMYSSMDHSNKNPNVSVIQNREGLNNLESFDSKKTLNIFNLSQKYSNYIKQNDGASLNKLDDYENYSFQRLSILKNLTSRRIKIVVPGNFKLTCGEIITLKVPVLGRKSIDEDNEDKTISANYLIVATRHLIKYDKHETILELTTTSSDNDFIPTSSGEQLESLLTEVE
jgi:hypothetical protein